MHSRLVATKGAEWGSHSVGLTFKENVPDTRNSKVIDIIRELQSFGVAVQVHDPLAHPDDAMHEYGVALTKFDMLKPADAVILAVAHDEYVNGGWSLIEGLLAEGHGLVFDVKMKLDRTKAPSTIELWRI